MYSIGIDLGGTKIAAGLVNEKNEIVAKASCATEAERGNDAVTASIAALIANVKAQKGVGDDEIAFVGIACPGALNCETGMVDRACNLYMERYPLGENLSKLVNAKIYIENDANAAALGEAVAGAAQGAKYSVMVTLGTGVGGGIVMDGKVYSGFNYAGGEFGHMVIEHGGRQCNCGRKGCWEAYSSATALIAMTKEEMEASADSVMHKLASEAGKVSGKTPFIAQRMGDEAGDRVVKKYIDYLACGVANVINLFQPDILCIGGGVSNEGAGLIEPLVKKATEESFTKNSDKQTVIKLATLGNEAGIIGAANLGR